MRINNNWKMLRLRGGMVLKTRPDKGREGGLKIRDFSILYTKIINFALS